MTWYANEIIFCATDAALAEVKSSTLLAPFAYHLKTLAQHPWPSPRYEHGLTGTGLLIVQPVCGPASPGQDWYSIETLDWSLIPDDTESHTSIHDEVGQRLSKYLDGGSVPPLSMRRTLAAMARKLGQPVIYYECAMWGGDIEHEYCLTYEPSESLFLFQNNPASESPLEDDVLRAGLLKLGLLLPTSYFAPHTRDFLTDTHKLR